MEATVIFALLALVCVNAAVAGHEDAVDDPYRDLWDRMQGTPATLPLCEAVLMNRLDIDAREAAVRSIHYEDAEVYRALMQGDADLIFVSAPAPGMLEEIWSGNEGEMPLLAYTPVAREREGVLCHAVWRQDLPESHPARQLVDWLLSAEGQKVMREAGYRKVEAA